MGDILMYWRRSPIRSLPAPPVYISLIHSLGRLVRPVWNLHSIKFLFQDRTDVSSVPLYWWRSLVESYWQTSADIIWWWILPLLHLHDHSAIDLGAYLAMADSTGQQRLYNCFKCGNLVCCHDDIISKNFQVRSVFSPVIDLRNSPSVNLPRAVRIDGDRWSWECASFIGKPWQGVSVLTRHEHSRRSQGEQESHNRPPCGFGCILCWLPGEFGMEVWTSVWGIWEV